MNSANGALYFDADIDNKKYLAKVVQMEDRYNIFTQNITRSNAIIEASMADLYASMGGSAFRTGLGNMQKGVSSFQSSVLRSNQSIQESFNRLGGSLDGGKVISNTDKLKLQFADMGRAAVNGNAQAAKSFDDLASSAAQSGSQITSIFSGLSGVIAGFLSIQAAQGFVSEIISIRTEFENLDVAFTTILKSKEKADQLMADVVEFAATTPFGLTEVAKSTKQLLAYGVAVEDVKDELNTLGNIAAGVSQPVGEIAYLYGTLKTQGRAYAMDIRQFTGRGIPIIQELANVLGVAKDEVMGLVEEGKVGFPEVQKAFQNMTGAGGAFFDLMQKQSLTTGGRISNLKDQIAIMFNSFGESNSGVINETITALQFLVKNYEDVIDVITLLIGAYGAYRAALAVTAAFNQANIQATAAHIAALNGETAAAAELAATKAAVTLQSKAYVGATLSEAQAAAVNSAAMQILAAQETASLTRKAALAASSAYFTAKQELETAARAGASATIIAEMQANLALLAVQKAEATQLATNAAAELATIEARTVNSAATVRITAAEGLRTIGLGLAAKAQAIYNSVLAAAPLAAAAAGIAVLAAGIYALTQANRSAEDAQKRINAIRDDSIIKYETEKKKIEEYVKIAKDASNSDTERAKAIKKLNDLSPEFLSGLNKANIATAEGSRLIDIYLKDLERKANGELAYAAKQENQRKIIDLQVKGKDAIDNFPFIGQKIQAIFSGQGNGNTKQIEDSIVANEIQILKNANARIDKLYAKDIKDFQLQGIADDKGDLPKSTKRTETFVKNEIKRLEDLRAGYELHSKEYRDYTKKINDLNQELQNAQGKQTTAQKKATNERLDALKAIDNAETRSKQKSLSDSEERLQKATDEANQLRALAKKGGLGAGAFTRIDEIERTNRGTIKYEDDTKLLMKELDRQKEIFDKYEEYKTNVSVQAANDRYGKEKVSFNTFAEYLESNIKPLQDASAWGSITGAEQNRLNALLELQKQHNIDLANLEAQRYEEVFNMASTADQKILKAQVDYQNALKTLGDNATKEQKENLLQVRNDAIDSAIQESNEKKQIFKDLNVEIVKMTRERALSEIQVIEDMLSRTKDISPEVRSELKQQLEYAKEVAALGSDAAYVNALERQRSAIQKRLETERLSNEEIRKYKQQLEEINAELKETTSLGSKMAKVSSGLSEVSGAFGTLSSSLQDINPNLAASLETLSDITKVGSDAAGAFTSFASGDILGGIGKTVSAIAGIFSIGAKSRESARKARAEMYDFYRAAELGELHYQSLLRERARKLLEINAIGLRGIEQQSEALRKQQDAINKEYTDTLNQIRNEQQITGAHTERYGGVLGIGRKTRVVYEMAGLQGATFDELERLYNMNKLTESAKELFEELQRLKNEGADVEQALIDAAKAADELATGTTVESLSDNIINDLRAGKTGLQNVMDSYTDIIQNALLSTFKSDVVDVEMKAFYARLSALAQSGGELTDEEIKQAQEDYIATRERIKKEFEDRQKITGVILSDSNQQESGITAAVKSITQDTAVAIEGLLRGIYDGVRRSANNNTENSVYLAKQIELISGMAMVQTEIRDNTGATAKNTADQLIVLEDVVNELKTIVTNTKPEKTGRDLGIGD